MQLIVFAFSDLGRGNSLELPDMSMSRGEILDTYLQESLEYPGTSLARPLSVIL